MSKRLTLFAELHNIFFASSEQGFIKLQLERFGATIISIKFMFHSRAFIHLDFVCDLVLSKKIVRLFLVLF